MTLKSKLYIFVIAFFLVITGFVAGSLLIFKQLSANFLELKSATEEHNYYEDVKFSITESMIAAKGWAITGDRKFKGLYLQRMETVHKSFTNLFKVTKNRESVRNILNEFQELKGIAGTVISTDNPVGNRAVLSELQRLDMKEEEIMINLNTLHSKAVNMISGVTDRYEGIKKVMAFYFVGLFTASSLVFLLLALFMRRMIAVPFNDILTASDRIISGDYHYRIGSGRRDEFGIIANRFDAMVEELHRIGEMNEDLYLSTRKQLMKLSAVYELAKAITSTLELDELLRKMAEEATKLLNAKGCIIRLLEDDKLIIKASFGLPREIEKMMTLAMGEGIPGKVAKEGKPLLVEDLSKMPEDWKIPHLPAKTVMTVPLMVRGSVIGTLGLYDKMAHDSGIVSFSADDLSTAEGFASLSAIAIEKAKMFEIILQRENEAIEAKKRLDILFESVHGGIITMQRDYNILSANRFVETWIGMSVNSMIGRSAIEIFHGAKGICPHCVAQATFETGEINAITQESGLNYAELTSYPIKDESGNITEAVVFIQDITDRVLYQEEMLALYREVAQTKEYLESLIDNSADAIITTDLNRIVTSWNPGAEKIYGYSAGETTDNKLLFIPDFLEKDETEYTERVKNGEVLKDIETVRKKKDGTMIEASLTLSPIKDASGAIIGISGISRDISEKKRVEKELIRRNQELSRLFFISSAMRSTLDLDRLLRMILTAVTMGDGLGFNRAVLFLMDEERNVLKGAMGVGPSNYEEAGRVWERLSMEKKSLAEAMQEIETGSLITDSFLDRLSLGTEIPLDSDCIFTRAIKERRPFNVPDAKNEPLSDVVLIQQFGTEAYAVVPLVSRDRVIGVLWVDNLFNKKSITDEDIRFLTAFSNQMAAAIESAKLFEKVSFAEAELENIFKSISDMVYFTDSNYVVKSVNRAIVERFGMPEKDIIGKKCYEVFHGVKEPPHTCPHYKTVQTKKASVEEVEDSYLGGTFLISTSPIFDPNGNFLGTVHIISDITEIKLIREKLANAERMAALGEVAAKVAHEIRNPLVSIGGFSQRLEKKLDGNLKEYAGIITNEVKRLEEILRDILDFVRQVRLSSTSTSINDLLVSTLSLVRPEIVERGILIEAVFDDVQEIMLDPDRIKEALLNVIKNAIQAVAAHGKITIRTYSWDRYVVAEISDTGTGIAEKDMPFIFDPFYTTKASGTGLGLAITQRVIEEHKGKVEVESQVSKGTTVKIYLPVLKEGK